MQYESELKKYMQCTQEYWYLTARQDGLTFLTKVPADPLYKVHDKILNCALEETFFLFQDRFLWNLATKRKFWREKYFNRVFFSDLGFTFWIIWTFINFIDFTYDSKEENSMTIHDKKKTKSPQATPCGATNFLSVNFTSNLPFLLHNLAN